MAGEASFLSQMEPPPLPLEEWEDTKETLHRYGQVVGKLRMELSPPRNHWWHVTLYVTPRGRTTGTPRFRYLRDLLRVTSRGSGFDFELDSLPVAGFYERFFSGLGSLGIETRINPKPFDLDDEQPLDANTIHTTCDPVTRSATTRR